MEQGTKTGYIELFKAVSERTLEMVIHWQRVGFVHGVMNTDNMSILGLTIDYGPYGWLEGYDKNGHQILLTFNTSATNMVSKEILHFGTY